MDISSFTAAGGNSSAARRARAKLQFRDRFGRWIEMGRGLKFKVRLNDGNTVSLSGKFVGSTDKPGVGQVFVPQPGNGLKGGFYEVSGANAQEILATLDPEILKEKGIEVGKAVDGTTVGERADADIPDQDDLQITEAPLGWQKAAGGYATEDGDFRAAFRADGSAMMWHGPAGKNPPKSVGGWPEVLETVDRVDEGADWNADTIQTPKTDTDAPNAAPVSTTYSPEQRLAAKAAVKDFDPEGTVAALIDSNAPQAEILAELDKDILWKAAKDDFDTRNYVELPFKYDKARWAEFEPKNKAIADLATPRGGSSDTVSPETPAPTSTETPNDAGPAVDSERVSPEVADQPGGPALDGAEDSPSEQPGTDAPESAEPAPRENAPETPEAPVEPAAPEEDVAPTGDLDALGTPIPTSREELEKRAAYLNRRIDRLDAEHPDFDKVYEALDQVNERLNAPQNPVSEPETPEIAPDSDVLPDDAELDEYVRQLEAEIAESQAETPEAPAEPDVEPVDLGEVLPPALTDAKIEMLDAYAAGKDTNEGNANAVDSIDSPEQADDVLLNLQRLPNSADTVTRPRANLPEPVESNAALINAERDPNTTVDSNVVMAEVEKNYTNNRRLNNGDLVVDSREVDNKRYDVVVRRTDREHFIAYVQETSLDGSGSRVLRLGNQTHSYTALKSKIERGRKQIIKPKPGYWMNRNQEKVEAVPRSKAGEFLLPAEAPVNGTDGPEADNRPAHVSYNGEAIAPGDWVDWTDWRETVNGQENPTYGMVFRGQVRSLQAKDPGHRGQKADYDYSDHVYAVFPEYNRIRGAKKPNSQQRDFVASNLRKVSGQQDALGAPFFAKRKELANPERVIANPPQAADFDVPPAPTDGPAETRPRAVLRPAAPAAPAAPNALIEGTVYETEDTQAWVDAKAQDLLDRFDAPGLTLLNANASNNQGIMNEGIELYALGDGSKAILKRTLNVRDNEKEIISSKLLMAMGVQNMVAVGTGEPREVLMTYAEGQLAGDNRDAMEDMAADVRSGGLASQNNAMITGLFDYITGNQDRHAWNWIISPDGQAMPFDHGLVSFDPQGRGSVISDLAAWALGGYTYSVFPRKESLMFSETELLDIRARIERIRGTFANANKLDWFQNVLDRLDYIISISRQP